MKKVMLVAVLSLGTMTAFAQEEVQAIATEATEVAVEATEEATEAVVAEEVAVEATEEATEAVATEEVAVEAQDAFTEVAIEELPEAITAALEAAHPGAAISKAYINEASQYKLEVAKEDGSAVELYADAEGNWIEM
ncbi:MAG: hypothetical protein WBM83_01065 [Flavobacteriaceae bacterium]